MIKKFRVAVFLLTLPVFATAQNLSLLKGRIMDSIPVKDSLAQSVAVYLPTQFDASRKWPTLFISDLKQEQLQAMKYLQSLSETHGFVLAASNDMREEYTLTKNMLIAKVSMENLAGMLPLDEDQIYSIGKGGGAQMAILMPTLIPEFDGVISVASAIPNSEILSSKNPYHFVGIVGKNDYEYPQVVETKELLGKLGFPYQILFHQKGHHWPDLEYLDLAFRIIHLRAMQRAKVPEDSLYRDNTYNKYRELLAKTRTSKDLVSTLNLLQTGKSIFSSSRITDSLDQQIKTLRKDRSYKLQKRMEQQYFLKEGLIMDDFSYYLEEDVATNNLKNLGWWKYQMESLEKFKASGQLEEKRMGFRLDGYLNALIEEELLLAKVLEKPDDAARIFLYMLKTITRPDEPAGYLNVISIASRYEDYGTALFYLEELLKKGYSDKDRLYSLEHTALFRIMPEFNELISKYLKDARYRIEDE